MDSALSAASAIPFLLSIAISAVKLLSFYCVVRVAVNANINVGFRWLWRLVLGAWRLGNGR